jgi:acetyl-CoA carboxylase biotin carboxyl carrier protein
VALTAKDVAEITRLLEESSFDELYLELDGMKLTLRRSSAAPGVGSSTTRSELTSPVEPGAASPAGQVPAPAKPSAASGSPARAPTLTDPNVMDVPAPLLGTFYRAPKPGAPSFVDVDSLVEEETIVGIIEVMKLMNTVRAGAQGRVTEIVARDGVLVEYGETLLRIRKTS